LREEIPDDEKPFDIPESWEWVRLGEVGSLTRGSGIKRTETRESGYPCIRYGELYTTYKIRFSITKSFVDEPLYDNAKKISNGDIVMTLTGENKTDIATAVVYEGQDEIAMGGDLTCWSHHGMESLYLVYLMNSPYAIGCKRKLATGDIIVHISNEKLSSILLPLPPLSEQKRIVAKLEELLPLCERLK
jgi:type I restriction enzyme S subunit